MMKRVILVSLLTVPAALDASWLTFGGDAQRSGYAKDETALTAETVKSMQLLWKIKLDNEPKQLNALTSPLVINPVYTNHGAETYVIVGGSSDNLFVVDADTGKLVWNKHFTPSAPPPVGGQSGSLFCPNALNDTPVLDRSPAGWSVEVISTDGMLHSLSIINGEDRFAPKPFVPGYSKNWSLNVSDGFAYTSLSQGCAIAKSGVYAMDLRNTAHPVTLFLPDGNGAGIWGRGGVAIGFDGTIFAGTGDGPVDPAKGKYSDAVIALSPKDLKLKDYYLPTNANYLTRKDLDIGNTTPVVFKYKGRELLVTGGKEGKLYLLDAKSPGGADHRTPLYTTPLLLNEQVDIAGRGFWGAFATYEDESGARWLYAAAWGAIASGAPNFPRTNGPAPNGCIMAFKVEEIKGALQLTPAWTSRDMQVPEPPVVINGVVMAVSSGEFTRQVKEDGAVYTGAERMALTTGHATLYAFDAASGKELFSSGNSMPSFTHFGGIAVSDGRVFVTTHDSTLYAFGLKDQ